jgi:quercetin dioxygenase-like cupin family protein
LLARDLNNVSGKELRMLTVEYVPGGASLAHRHTFYEGPEDIHTVSANASATEPARILVFMVKDKAAPSSTAISPEHAP